MDSNVSIASSVASMITEKPKLLMETRDDASSFIHLTGMPPPELLDATHTLGPGLASSTDALVLNAMAFPEIAEGESVATKEIDVIDAGNEDPFTLDTFETLITAHMNAKMDFILARVLTMEEKEDSKRLFYSYYAAHQINRSLFRTQPDEGLLHRMKAKNPMNNLTIVGDVHYYVIKYSDPACNPFFPKEQAIEKTVLDSINKSNVMLPSEDAISLQDMLSEEAKEAKLAAAAGSSATIDRMPELASDNVSIDFAKSSRTALKQQQPPASSVEPARPLKFVAKYYATDDDYLMRRYVREYFKQNSLNPEDIFLFTLFGASQHNGDTFSSPFVSDPTNPTAVACTIEQAVAMHLAAQNGSQVVSTDNTLDRDRAPQNEERPSFLRALFEGLVTSLSGRPRYSSQTVVTPSTATSVEQQQARPWFSSFLNHRAGTSEESLTRIETDEELGIATQGHSEFEMERKLTALRNFFVVFQIALIVVFVILTSIPDSSFGLGVGLLCTILSALVLFAAHEIIAKRIRDSYSH